MHSGGFGSRGGGRGKSSFPAATLVGGVSLRYNSSLLSEHTASYALDMPFDRTMARKRKTDDPKPGRPPTLRREITHELRIVGGRFRGSKLSVGGDPRVRPMKDRVREAIFNLVGPDVVGKHVLDLFAGTGALALEALSRGALVASLVERHFPTVDIIEQNVRTLGVEDKANIIAADAFYWVRHEWEPRTDSWLVLCSPPYSFFVERREEMLSLIHTIIESVPGRSIIVAESDERFDFGQLPRPDEWDVRHYPPAVVGIWRS